jgi:protein TonB
MGGVVMVGILVRGTCQHERSVASNSSSAGGQLFTAPSRSRNPPSTIAQPSGGMIAVALISEESMFALLIESRAVRRRSPAGFAASLALHGIIVAGAIITTARAAGPREPQATQIVLEYRAPVPEPPRIVSAPAAAVQGPLVIGPSVISVPIDVPDFIPSINPLRTLINIDQPVEFRVGTPTRQGTPDPGALTGTGGVLLVDQVEVPVTLDRRSPMPRFPQLLRDAGVEGMARLSFVVDTLGRVEIETVRVMESTHAAFAAAVQVTLPRMRFAPARIGGRAVRQLVEFPVQFHLAR